jgi:hypothetical protein
VKKPPPTFSTNSGFSSSFRRVATKARAEPPKVDFSWTMAIEIVSAILVQSYFSCM